MRGFPPFAGRSPIVSVTYVRALFPWELRQAVAANEACFRGPGPDCGTVFGACSLNPALPSPRRPPSP
jgi:hypothetical protein